MKSDTSTCHDAAGKLKIKSEHCIFHNQNQSQRYAWRCEAKKSNRGARTNDTKIHSSVPAWTLRTLKNKPCFKSSDAIASGFNSFSLDVFHGS